MQYLSDAAPANQSSDAEDRVHVAGEWDGGSIGLDAGEGVAAEDGARLV